MIKSDSKESDILRVRFEYHLPHQMRLYTHPYYIDDECFGFTFDLTPYLKKVRCNKKRVARK